MQNAQLIKELLQVLEDMDYAHLYRSSDLLMRLRDSSTDGDRIRLILRDPDVQEYLFPNWRDIKDTIHDARAYYIQLRKNGTIAGR